ncbi:MAG: DUF4965 domain-containing protein [Planctomycetota bacterium]
MRVQLMTWPLGRLGSRFGLLFEPYQRRVMHSALGRFLDRPLDLLVGMVDVNGTVRTLPLTRDEHAVDLDNCEQFDRMNSITFRGQCVESGVRFEANFHGVFYPQDEALCTMPAFYLELRAHPGNRVRWHEHNTHPKEVELLIRLRRPETHIRAEGCAVDLAYDIPLASEHEFVRVEPPEGDGFGPGAVARARERLVSLNAEAEPLPSGDGLRCRVPVTEPGSGVKWRLVWAAHVEGPVLRVKTPDGPRPATLLYADRWRDLDETVEDAVRARDERLAKSRRFERMLEQAPLDAAENHLLHQAFQSYLTNTWWCVHEGVNNPTDPSPSPGLEKWFSVWDGSCLFHSPVDVEYNAALFYLTLWPDLLRMQLEQWPRFTSPHAESGGRVLGHDFGQGIDATVSGYPHAMPVEENCNFLLLLQTFGRWTGDAGLARRLPHLVQDLAQYLLWTDRDGSGFPSEGVANTIDDASPAVQFGKKQTYLAVKRVAALRAAADLLALGDDPGFAPFAKECESAADLALERIEREAWLGDHYAVCLQRSAAEMIDPWTGKPPPIEELEGWDAYSIYTGNGLVLPAMIGREPVLAHDRIVQDLRSADRENQSRYGDGHTSAEVENTWTSQNLWRDMLARYLRLSGPGSAGRYWDLQVMSNTHTQSLGFSDSYVNNYIAFSPRGVTAFGYFLSSPRLVIDRLAPGPTGSAISIDPNRSAPSRWPLLPLADWKAGKVPVSVVDGNGRATLECEIEAVEILGEAPGAEPRVAGGLIG